MAGESPPQVQLDYATPARPGDVDVRQRPDHFHVDLGPTPASVFVAGLIPYLIIPTVAASAIASILLSRSPDGSWAVAAALLVAAAPSLRAVGRLSRYRHVARTIGGTPECIYYSNASTRGRVDSVLRGEISSVGVRRSWWHPWICELVAIPRYKFLTLTAKETEPVTLLSGRDHAALEEIAFELRSRPESQMTPLGRPAVPPQPRYTSM